MAYYPRRRRSNPKVEERREREQKEQEEFAKNRESLNELLRNFRKVPLRGDNAQRAWGFPAKRTFTVGRLSDGSQISYILRGDDENEVLYLMEPHFPSWRFYRLDPKYHVTRKEEEWEQPQGGHGFGY